MKQNQNSGFLSHIKDNDSEHFFWEIQEYLDESRTKGISEIIGISQTAGPQTIGQDFWVGLKDNAHMQRSLGNSRLGEVKQRSLLWDYSELYKVHMRVRERYPTSPKLNNEAFYLRHIYRIPCSTEYCKCDCTNEKTEAQRD